VLRSSGSRWARGHFHRGEGTYAPVPGPGDEVPDLEAMFPDEAGPEYADELEGQADELEPDPGPADLRGERPGLRTREGAVRASVRRDIAGKLKFALGVPGEIYRAKDPICGSRFVEQIPAMADAWTEYIIDSPDLVDFFTGPAGGFMKALKIGSATWPALEIVLTHHVFGHGHQADDERRQAPAGPDLSRYQNVA
jgi:hypothetical protein